MSGVGEISKIEMKMEMRGLMLLLLMLQACVGGISGDEGKVELSLYYESLCPYSARFIVNGLSTIFKNGLINIVDLKLFPWGNAKLKSDKSFTCQHGEDECLLNTVEACAINAWPKVEEYFPFVYCVENMVTQWNYTEWKTCFQKLGLDPKPVEECYPNEEGKQLELKYGGETGGLIPPHKYVPWVVVDGKPLYDDYENFTSYVCKAYKGSTPPVCKSPHFYSAKPSPITLVDHESINIDVGVDVM